MIGCKIYEKCGRDCTHCSVAEAVKKQESIKTEEVPLPFGKVYECTNCGSYLAVNEVNGMYCHWCGQKLEW